MKFARSLWLILLFINLQPLSSQSVNPYTPAHKPDRINLTVTEDPSTSVSVTRRTDTSVKVASAELLLANANPASVSNTERLEATTEIAISKNGSYKTLQWDGVAASYHSVTFNHPKPKTVYTYRVGSGDNWSEWFQFKTAGLAGEQLSFLYFGDAQTGLRSMWAKVIRKAYEQMPHAQLMLHAGDLVNRAERDEEWGEWFEAGSFIHATIPNQVVSIHNDKLKFRSYTVTEELFDAFDLLKQKGTINKLVEMPVATN